MISNIVGNAIQHQNPDTPGGTIHITTGYDDGQVFFSVRDQGPGIPAEDLPHIFERFYRVDKARSREQGGTGLGLSIVKHIVQSHGGKVWAKSELGKGASFYFTLPVKHEVSNGSATS